MHEKITRRTALAAAAAGLTGAASSALAARTPAEDPAFAAIEARMTDVARRAPSLNSRQKYAALFAAAVAAGSPTPFFSLTQARSKPASPPLKSRKSFTKPRPTPA